MDKQPKIWAKGLKVKQIKFERSDKIGLDIYDLDEFVNFLYANKKEYTNKRGETKASVKIECWRRKEDGKFGETHDASIDTYVPNKGGSNEDSDSLPF